MFNSEASLVDSFIKTLKVKSPWGDITIGKEFNYQRGRTDLVGISNGGLVIAFEAKLTKWRRALQQAYRNRCFADLSYVVLPENSAKNALRNIEEFERRGVGICYIKDGHINIIFDAYKEEPIQPWLKEKAYIYASGGI